MEEGEEEESLATPTSSPTRPPRDLTAAPLQRTAPARRPFCPRVKGHEGGEAEALGNPRRRRAPVSPVSLPPELGPRRPGTLRGAAPMSVSLVVLRLELAESSPVPGGFSYSAAGKGQGAWGLLLGRLRGALCVCGGGQG